MELETDPKRVERLAREREDENWEFRSFLKGSDLDSAELDAIVRRHYRDVAAKIDCCACGHCCRVAIPTMSRADIARLASGLKMTREELTRRYLRPDDEKKDRLTFNAKPCPMLSGTRCTVYESRPSECRSFPHLHKKDFSTRLIRVVENCSFCPIVFNVFERLKEELWDESDNPWDY